MPTALSISGPHTCFADTDHQALRLRQLEQNVVVQTLRIERMCAALAQARSPQKLALACQHTLSGFTRPNYCACDIDSNTRFCTDNERR